ncbi:Zn-dependent alcohol dehydrogenase [Nakamurella leprariae]|uniref:Zn-dependent alcohol dehydrogenase n=1 Tax=Nakamurella leprariae TaxID=2803911 RepID=A0A938YHL0_9ACTN|nr:Zn-dependent alcohol dehydrogenase [Nakamurella leprariae]MBM9467973.1 Zn-dependent alcohol dehydrogenase [Nakamurella leprariae]
MRAAVLRELPGEFAIEEITLADPGPHEVRVRIVGSGLCHSDLHVLKGALPYPVPTVLGHEVSGVVEQVGDQVRYVAPGDHVIACLSTFCGHCRECLSGKPHLCHNPETLRGEHEPPRISNAGGERISQFANISGFAEEILVHEHTLVKIDQRYDLGTVAILGCAAVTGMGAVFNTTQVEAGATVAVIGAGGIGLHAVQAARIAGAGKVIIVDTNPGKLDRARMLGATHAVDASSTDAVEAVREITGGGVDYSFECVGLVGTAEQAYDMLGWAGTATIVGVLPAGSKVSLSSLGLFQERRFQGCSMGSNRFRSDIPRYLDFYDRGLLDIEAMISKRITLDEINEGYAALERGETARSVIVFDH